MLDYALSRRVQPTIIPEIVVEFSLGLREMGALVRLYRLIRQEHAHKSRCGSAPQPGAIPMEH
jgi:hypothetical protein